MRIAVTGGGGELGRFLAPYLLEQGHAVVSIDRAPPPADAPRAAGLEYLVADLRDLGQLVSVARGCDALVHLAAHRSPIGQPDHVVYTENTAASYHALSAAVILGIQRVCLASSINAIGGAFSAEPRYDYLPLDEAHPTYAEDPYSLSKWVLEQQADAFARRYPAMTIASLRFHWLLDSYERAVAISAANPTMARRHLWAYTLLPEAARACLLALGAEFRGHEVFYIVGPQSVAAELSLELARDHYPAAQIHGDLAGRRGFFNCAKAERLLGWRHAE